LLISSSALSVFAAFVDGKMAEGSEPLFDLVTPQNGSIAGRVSELGILGINKAVNAAQRRQEPAHKVRTAQI
jgi:hypothetical protein